MNQSRCSYWQPLGFGLLAGMAIAVSGCSNSPAMDSSPVARTLRLPTEWRMNSEDRALRKAVEADAFPSANEHGL
ncbi:MAG: hypothetical protein U1E05_03945 [Patescibacteria group bacterium]|nr:hypothetical protein [Patescibacteria group bacterium]